jgi:hypothetical protein
MDGVSGPPHWSEGLPLTTLEAYEQRKRWRRRGGCEGVWGEWCVGFPKRRVHGPRWVPGDPRPRPPHPAHPTPPTPPENPPPPHTTPPPQRCARTLTTALPIFGRGFHPLSCRLGRAPPWWAHQGSSVEPYSPLALANLRPSGAGLMPAAASRASGWWLGGAGVKAHCCFGCQLPGAASRIPRPWLPWASSSPPPGSAAGLAPPWPWAWPRLRCWLDCTFAGWWGWPEGRKRMETLACRKQWSMRA